MYKALFGNEVAERCLQYIVNYGDGYIRGIASTFNYAPGQVRNQLERMESGGLLVSRFYGNTKVFSINPRLAIKKELESLTERMLSLLPEEETERYSRQRRRPRRTGKTL
jgi:hypothetical protein